MNPQLFSFWGYISIALWLVVPVLWALHALRRPRRRLCHYALIVAAAALVFAKINSVTHVNRIQVDHSEELAAAQARQEAARKAAEAARAGEVAHVRFAEDDATDFLDEGGMDEADRKYMATFDEQATPEWKKEKKTRSAAPREDDSLEAMLDTSAEVGRGVEADLVEKAAVAPILMPEKQKMLANRLDAMNLKLTRLLILIGLGIVIIDYLRRANIYEEAYFPLPLPSRWTNGLTPLPAVRAVPATPRRTLPEELEWLTRNGDVFLYLADDAESAVAVPRQLARLPRGHAPLEVLHVDGSEPLLDDTFIFESLWHSRASFVFDSAGRAEAFLVRMFELLQERKTMRARTRQTVHVVWDLPTPPDQDTLQAFERLGGATGVVLVMKG